MFLDLDDFKNVTTRSGTRSVTRCWSRLPERLRASLRRTTWPRAWAVTSRVLLEHAPSAVRPKRAAERVLVRCSLPCGGGHARACAREHRGRARERSAHSADELLRNADLAMYSAKRPAGLAAPSSRPACTTRARPACACQRPPRGHRTGADRAVLPALVDLGSGAAAWARGGARALASSPPRALAAPSLHRASPEERT